MEEWKELQAEAPTLTFTPFEEPGQSPAELAAEEPKRVEQVIFDESTLTPEERKMVDDFASQINFRRNPFGISRKFSEVWRNQTLPDGVLEGFRTGLIYGGSCPHFFAAGRERGAGKRAAEAPCRNRSFFRRRRTFSPVS